MGLYLLLMILPMLGMFIQSRLTSKFTEYGSMPLSGNITGKQIAEKMLSDNGIFDVKVVSVEGHLSDHYNPLDKTVNLSPEVYNNASIAAAAVAAHECGHAVQHHVGYTWLTMRSKMVPTLSLSSKFMPFILMGGMLLIRVFPALLLVGIILFAITTIFSIVTLPVEVDASRRALAWLETTNMTRGEEHDKAKDALKWAAYTYFAAAIGSLVTLLYYINIYLGNRNRN